MPLLTKIEHMDQEALARLRRLGVVKGVRHLKAAPPRQPEQTASQTGSQVPRASSEGAAPLATLLPGLSLAQTDAGGCYVLDKVYPLGHRHGPARLQDLLAYAGSTAARMSQDPRLASIPYSDYLFLDTETTGLGGAGTIAFMVGVGFFEGGAFVVRQYFLRDHADEEAMLLLLDELLARHAGLITFNGRSFDLPLLQGRFLMHRVRTPILEWPHVDLLPPARRLWRRRLASCALGSLEQDLLGLQRSEDDVPGWLIPSLYNEYVRTGDGRDMVRVFYHNRIDILSMVTLAAHVLRLFAAPEPGDHPIDLLALGIWQEKLGHVDEAEYALRLAAVPEMPTPLYQEALTHLAYLLKRNERREEALPLWQQIACTTFDDVTAHVELAMHFEWHDVDLEQAQRWTEEALALVEGEGAGETQAALLHRLTRLRRKIDQSNAADG